MKKMILIAVAVLISPFVFAAEQTVPDGNAFVIAKAVKLGRGKVYSVKGGKSYGAGRFKVEKNVARSAPTAIRQRENAWRAKADLR